MSFTSLDSNDLDYWSGQPSSKADIALIISRLIRATTHDLKGAILPVGKSTYSGGWDGEVINSQATEFVPKGLSFWELGTENRPGPKAEKDYVKRTKQTKEELRRQATFVLVTTRTWNKKGDWIKEKTVENQWKAIQVIDGKSLSEWLALSPIISQQVATLMGRKINSAIESPQQFWDNWSKGPENISISLNLITAGRKKTTAYLLEKLGQPAKVIPVQASNKEEAIAFITATLLTAPNQEYYLAQTALVNNEEDFKLLIHEKPGILIPRFEAGSVSYTAASLGHRVLLPLGADSSLENADKIVLPKLGRDEVLTALQDMGLSEDQGRTLSRETGRNITVIRRRMGFEGTRPEWANYSAFIELLPVLLAGKWQDDKLGDQLIISHLAGRTYDEQLTLFRKWIISGDKPIIYVGVRWQLVSPLDAWTYLGPFLSEQQLKLLRESFLITCGDIKPFLQLEPEQRPWAALYGKLPDFSHGLREGLTQSLILVALYGTNYQLPLSSNPQHWVDSIIAELCSKHEGDLWKSLDDVLPLIAEASPRAFLASLENFLQQAPDKLQQIFENGGGLISPAYYHTGLLWALEGLAWLPQYLSRCCIVLVQLNHLDPGVKILNKPINSLHQILHPWMPQTYASLSERKAVVRLIDSQYPDFGWQLCLTL
ncbi:MAG: hypothetical protein JST32_08165, partial [Bacteroidetes bacterium]|nr:hypothetical protein [Bacteroidota bacterium]